MTSSSADPTACVVLPLWPSEMRTTQVPRPALRRYPRPILRPLSSPTSTKRGFLATGRRLRAVQVFKLDPVLVMGSAPPSVPPADRRTFARRSADNARYGG